MKQEDERVFAGALFEILNYYDGDDSGKGLLDYEEFALSMELEGELAPFLKLHGIDIRDNLTFFQLVTSASGRQVEEGLEVLDLVSACCRLRGQSSSLDVAMLQYELRQISRQISHLQAGVGENKRPSESNADRQSPCGHAADSFHQFSVETALPVAKATRNFRNLIDKKSSQSPTETREKTKSEKPNVREQSLTAGEFEGEEDSKTIQQTGPDTGASPPTNDEPSSEAARTRNTTSKKRGSKLAKSKSRASNFVGTAQLQ